MPEISKQIPLPNYKIKPNHSPSNKINLNNHLWWTFLETKISNNSNNQQTPLTSWINSSKCHNSNNSKTSSEACKWGSNQTLNHSNHPSGSLTKLNSKLKIHLPHLHSLRILSTPQPKHQTVSVHHLNPKMHLALWTTKLNKLLSKRQIYSEEWIWIQAKIKPKCRLNHNLNNRRIYLAVWVWGKLKIRLLFRLSRKFNNNRRKPRSQRCGMIRALTYLTSQEVP